MNTLEFLKEYQRMCRFYVDCDGCPLHEKICLNDYVTPSIITEDNLVQFINDVEDWSRNHPLIIDWTKVPRNTPVLVSDSPDKEKWIKRYFCAYIPHSIDGKFLTFYDGDDENNAYDVSYWHYCKLDPEATSTSYLKTKEK